MPLSSLQANNLQWPTSWPNHPTTEQPKHYQPPTQSHHSLMTLSKFGVCAPGTPADVQQNLAHQLTHPPTNQLTNRLTNTPTDRLAGWLTDKQTD